MTEADPQISTKAHSERSASDRRLQVIRTRKIWNYFWTVAFNSAIALTLVHLSAIRYDSGLANYLEVIDAQIRLYPAERSALLYDLGRKIAIVNLYRALGGGWNLSEQQWVRASGAPASSPSQTP